MTFTNPRREVEFDNWPIGGSNWGKCRYTVEHNAKGYRVIRTTTNKHGAWCKPKMNTYAGKAVIVEGSDGKTHILQHITRYAFISVMTHDFMIANQNDTVYQSSNPEIYAELLAMIESAYT